MTKRDKERYGHLFDGETFDKDLDGPRLTSQLELVKQVASTGAWWTLRHLATLCGGTEASISARLRDLRKEKFGGYVVEKRRIVSGATTSGGLWVYRVLPPKPKDAVQLELIRGD